MHEPKKIFVESQRLFRKHKHGIEVVALELLQRLGKTSLPYNIEVLVKEDEDHCLNSNGCLSVTTLPSVFYPVWEQLSLPEFTAKYKNSILHCTGNTAPCFGKTPLIVTIHDLIFLENNYLFKKDGGSLYQRFGNFYRSIVVPVVAKKAKHIITVSNYQKKSIMKRLRIPDEKISVVYNGADERFFNKASKKDITQTLQIYNINFPYIFFLANTEPRKNTNGVIKAFASFCGEYPQFQHKLVIKGLTEEQLKNKLKECEATEYAHRVHRVDYIAYEHLPLIYQGASILWFPSFNEGFGLPLVEAMASAVPVITSSVSVMPEITADAALYIDPHEPLQLVAQTVSLFTNAELQNTLIRKGEERAQQFTWKKSVTELLKVYDKVLEQL
jgi:glycosyltransferase involved in cell wall biosynthesis